MRRIVKFNGGEGAILCNFCKIIVKENLTKEEIDSKEPMFCEKCSKFNFNINDSCLIVNIGCCRTDRPPWNKKDPNQLYWAYLLEDQIDGYGSTAAEALGNLLIEIAECYEGFEMPYIESIKLEEDNVQESTK